MVLEFSDILLIYYFDLIRYNNFKLNTVRQRHPSFFSFDDMPFFINPAFAGTVIYYADIPFQVIHNFAYVWQLYAAYLPPCSFTFKQKRPSKGLFCFRYLKTLHNRTFKQIAILCLTFDFYGHIIYVLSFLQCDKVIQP